MDGLAEEQAIQEAIGQDFGIDINNVDIDQLDRYLGDNKICLPEEAIPAIAFTHNGRPLGIPPASGSPPQVDPCYKLNTLNNFHEVVTSTPPHSQQQMNSAYSCSRLNTTIPGLQAYDNPLVHPTLPDSPPDSEPYSPPDGHHNHAMNGNHTMNGSNHITSSQESKYGIGSTVTTMHQHMYAPSHHRPPGMPPGVKSLPPGYSEPPTLNHMPVTHPPPPQCSTPLPLPSSQMNSQIQNHMSPNSGCNMAQNKKRKYPDSPNSTLTNAILTGRNGVLNIKQEPNGPSLTNYMVDCDDDGYGYDPDTGGPYLDSTYQVIKWSPFHPNDWPGLKDENLKSLPPPMYRVDADKGFNFSQPDDAFVCQKKNHFQVTVHMQMSGDPKYIQTPDGVKKIDSFYLHFNGIKMESQSQLIKIEQSQSDRSKKPFYPVRVDLISNQTNKVTVGRLHFSETTSNNMRKKGRPNPDQRYFMLVVALYAHSGDNKYMVAGNVSERIIVRASNPGQFDSDVDVSWQKGQTPDGVYHVGRVGINTDHPEEALTVHGNLRLTGHLLQPSDIRAKEQLKEVDSKDQLKKVSQMKIYQYKYSEDFAQSVGIPETDRENTGVIAQEVQEVLPDAVKKTGDIPLQNGEVIEDLLVVDKDRIFMENVGAVKELCKLTDNLEVRIDELEKMNKRLSRLKRYDSLKSTVSSKSSCSTATISSSSPKKPTTMNHYSSSHRHTNHKSSSEHKPPHPSENGWCSNRFIQITIITLILIMAFCLIAITVLYILERQKEDTHARTTTSMEIRKEHLVQSPSPSTTPPAWNITTARQSTLISTLKIVSQSQTTTTQPSPPPVLPPYPYCDQQLKLCEIRCCPPPQQHDEGHVTGAILVSPKNGPSYRVFTQPVTKKEVVTEPLPQVVTEKPQTESPQVIINGINQSNLDEPQVKYNDPGDINSNEIKVRYYRYKRDVSTEDLDADIFIKELNQSIGPEFCTEKNASSKTYKILLSQFFSYEQVTFQFRMPSNQTSATMCYNHIKQNCVPGQQGELDSSLPNQWKIPVGQYFHSTFKFRVAPKDTANVCSLPFNSNTASEFMEFTLIFDRQCVQ